MCCIWEKFGQICGIFGAWPKAVGLWSLDCLTWLKAGQCTVGQINKIWLDTAMDDLGAAMQCHISLLGNKRQGLTGLCNIHCPTWRWHLVRLASWRIWLVGLASVRNAIMRCLGKLVPCWGNILKVSSGSTLCVWFISAVSLYSKTREERARGVPTKKNEVACGTFLLQRQYVNPALEANVS